MPTPHPIALSKSETAAVVAAVTFWCDRRGISIRDEDGQAAMEAAIRILLKTSLGLAELLDALEDATRKLH